MHSKQQHYVPRCLLKNFAKGKKPQIWVYDKHADTIFRTNIKNVAAERGFYDLSVDDNLLTVEPSLAHLESHASSIISTLINTKNLGRLDVRQRTILSVFLAVQFVRTKEHRVRFDVLGDLFIDKLKERGASDEETQQLIGGTVDSKRFGLRSILDTKRFIPHFLNKAWALFETGISTPLYVSDNPITLHNKLDHEPYGNLGLSVRGIEIYVPLSTTLCLGLLCPSIGNEYVKAYDNFRLIDEILPGKADQLLKNSKRAREFCEGVVSGTSISLEAENVSMLNSLQVLYSSRFVYCETNNFDLVKRMIANNEAHRHGLRPKAE